MIQKCSPCSFFFYRLRTGSASVSILDLDKASGDFVDFLDDIRRLTSEYQDANDTGEGRQLAVSTILVPPLQAGLGFRGTAELSSIYENLIQTWIVPLSRQMPGRVRIALEKLLRDLAGQICLASHAMRVDVEKKGEDEAPQPENVDTGARFVLPVRRRGSATSLGKGKGKEQRSDAVSSPLPASSQISEDAGFMPSSASAALPTPEPTPSLRSRSSLSSLTGSGYRAGQRLQAYASLTSQPALPMGTHTLLGHWQTGVDPASYDWEAAQRATVTENESGDESQKRQGRGGAETRRKRPRDGDAGPSSQPTPKRLGVSQPQPSQTGPSLQGSSQPTERGVIMSQVEPGKFGGRHAKGKKKIHVRPRPAGFK